MGHDAANWRLYIYFVAKVIQDDFVKLRQAIKAIRKLRKRSIGPEPSLDINM